MVIIINSPPTRYDLGEEHAREKERYAAKERDEVIRKSKERRLADTKVHTAYSRCTCKCTK